MKRILYWATERRTFMACGVEVPDDATPEEIQAACEEDWDSDEADLSETETVFDWEGKPPEMKARVLTDDDWSLIESSLAELAESRREEAVVTMRLGAHDASNEMKATSAKAAALALRIAAGAR